MDLYKYMDKLEVMADQYENLGEFRIQINAVLDTLSRLQKHDLPKYPLPKLGMSNQFIYDHLIDYPGLMEDSGILENFRQIVIENFGIWHIFSKTWIEDLKIFCGKNSHNFEVMAGNAVISTFLPHTIATDNLNWHGQDVEKPHPWTQIEQIDALKAVQKYSMYVDNIIMAWSPDHDEIDWQILKELRRSNFQGNFIVIGEPNGATNSAKFWEEAQLTKPFMLNCNHQPFDFIRDEVFTVR